MSRSSTRRRALAALLALAATALVLVIVLPQRGAALSGPTLPTNDLAEPARADRDPDPGRGAAAGEPRAGARAGPAGRLRRRVASARGRAGAGPRAARSTRPRPRQGWTCNLPRGRPLRDARRIPRLALRRPGRATCAPSTTRRSCPPLNVVSLAGGPSTGVDVLDMSDPAASGPDRDAHPAADALAARVAEPQRQRGLLAAELGNGAALPGPDVDLRRQPATAGTRCSTRPTSPRAFGHESGFSPDGRTFWIGGGEGIAAVDVSDPKHPHTIWQGNEFAHGLNVSDDGNTLYDCRPDRRRPRSCSTSARSRRASRIRPCARSAG